VAGLLCGTLPLVPVAAYGRRTLILVAIQPNASRVWIYLTVHNGLDRSKPVHGPLKVVAETDTDRTAATGSHTIFGSVGREDCLVAGEITP